MAIQKQVINAEHFLELVDQPQYDDCVLELVEGALIEMSKPTFKHGVITMRLAAKMAHHVDEHELATQHPPRHQRQMPPP